MNEWGVVNIKINSLKKKIQGPLPSEFFIIEVYLAVKRIILCHFTIGLQWEWYLPVPSQNKIGYLWKFNRLQQKAKMTQYPINKNPFFRTVQFTEKEKE